MAEIVPFGGLRYDERAAGPLAHLICPPYDVISNEQREALYARSPYNFVRVEYGKADPADDQTSDRYSRARALIERWLAEGIFRHDRDPAFYLYDHTFELNGQRLRRRGFFGALRLYPLEEGVVRPHEQTIPKDKSDRLSLLRRTRVNTSPVFGLFEDAGGGVAAILEGWAAGGPIAEVEVGSERHALWLVDDAGPVRALQTALRDSRVYLADGHHRYEVALEYLKEATAPRPAAGSVMPESYVLTYLCALDDPGLRILPTHRIVTGARSAIDAAVARSFDVSLIDRGALADTQPGIVLVRDGVFTRLEPRADIELSALPETWRSLPLAQAEALLIEAARRAGAQVRYEHDTDRAIDAAVAGADAILLREVDAMTLKEVADRGQRLPPKTTYFYPKVPAGLLVRPLDARLARRGGRDSNPRGSFLDPLRR